MSVSFWLKYLENSCKRNTFGENYTMTTIACIPADNAGNKLFLKEPRMDGEKIFVKYRSTFNDIPFVEVELYPADGGKSCVITGDDGTVLWRFSTQWLQKISE